MKVRVLGGGWYGCHIALALLRAGHHVELHEIAPTLFAGASGGNPARLHIGPHYPRSHLTRAACRDHHAEFMVIYGHLTRGVPINLYAIADRDSQVDFGTYCHVLRNEIDFVAVDPTTYGLVNVEGVILCNERHIIISQARAYFEQQLAGHVWLQETARQQAIARERDFDLTIDATFCANDARDIDRFEPCLTALLRGPTERAVTIMDGPFGSIYPWDESLGLCSLTHAALTPFAKTCKTWTEANELLLGLQPNTVAERGHAMLDEMATFWPRVRSGLYKIAGYRFSIRAMPRSAADARLVGVDRINDRLLRVRAGKIDAVFHAERMIKEMLAS